MKIQTLNGAIATLHFEWQLCAAEQTQATLQKQVKGSTSC